MNERYERGLRKLIEIDGDSGKEVMNDLETFAPDLTKYIIEYSFGDVYSRTRLKMKHKEIAVVAALVSLGNAEPQLKVHLNAALNVGCTINEIKEVLLQMAGYSGFPSTINALILFMNVVTERTENGFSSVQGKIPSQQKVLDGERYSHGVKVLSELNKNQARILEDSFSNFMPELTEGIMNNYAEVYDRDNLGKKERQIATIAALSAKGNSSSQLKFHIDAGLNVGLEVQEIKEIMILISVYSGFPSSINGMYALKEVIDTRNKESNKQSGNMSSKIIK